MVLTPSFSDGTGKPGVMNLKIRIQKERIILITVLIDKHGISILLALANRLSKKTLR